ncbi:unnamed protein product [Cyclocybe aegerita]|uniref:Uncharacterized protein n=1 Tax=Cyclocybe aegerita TaxID=1973307 RepID=A0A8S0VRB3_CYCAE|nr:unnamed protein product [Cyclocybe aegerita]
MEETAGTTDRVDIKSFYPLLSYLIQLSHFDGPAHPALLHQVISSPHPTNHDDVVGFPDGSPAKLVMLGKPIPPSSLGQHEWWPTAISSLARERLMHRIMREGFVLPILLAVCVSLVSEMYSTTAVPPSEEPLLQYTGRRRIRLTYHRTPIADFGIVKGPVKIGGMHRLAYYSPEKNIFMHGQDPNDHYWIYFKTISGEELLLDCSLGTFNMGLLVSTDPYINPNFYMTPLGLVPSIFHDREYRRETVLSVIWQSEKERFSILRDPQVHQALGYHDPGLQWPGRDILYSLMKKIAGRPSSELEKELLLKFCETDSFILRQNLHHQSYLTFPELPKVGCERELNSEGKRKPSEPDEEVFASFNHMKKFTRKYRRGEVTGGDFMSHESIPRFSRDALRG